MQGIQGIQGETGNGIASITKTSTVGLVDTYTITYTDGTTTTFEVTNGQDGDVTEAQLQDVYDQMSSEMETATKTGESIDADDSAYWKCGIMPKGNTEQATAILPSEYKQVDYIEASGTQYIETDTTSSSRIEITTRINFNDVTTRQLTGASGGAYFGVVNGYWQLGQTGTDASSILTASTNTWYDVVLEKRQISGTYTNTLTVNGVSDTYTRSFSAKNIRVFATGETSSASYGMNAKIAFYKIKKDNVLVHDLIPCYRIADDVIGMYDLVNNVFYTNAGTGDFIKGADAVLPNPDFATTTHVVSGSNNVKMGNKNLIDWANPDSVTSNTTATFVDDILAVANTTGTNRRAQYVITDLWKNNAGKLLYIQNDNIEQSGSSNLQTMQIVVAYTDGTSATYYGAKTNREIEIPNDVDNVSYVHFRVYSNNSSTSQAGSITITKPMLAFGEIATDYVRHAEQNYPITLPIGMELCKIGDYQDFIYKSGDNWYKHKAIGKVVFDGTEGWSSMGWTNHYGYRTDISDIKQTTESSQNSNIISNYFKVYKQNELNQDGIIGISNRANQAQIIVQYDAMTTNTEIKTWLNTHNTTVYYVLATPVEEQITDTTLINQLNQLEKAKTYQGVTHITQTNADEPFILTLDYKKSNLLRIKALENA